MIPKKLNPKGWIKNDQILLCPKQCVFVSHLGGAISNVVMHVLMVFFFGKEVLLLTI